MDFTHALLHQIAAKHDFARLEALRDMSVWIEWPDEARHALALLFAEYAASSLKGEARNETFSLAELLAPGCPLLATRRAIMLSSQQNDVDSLENALLAFEKAQKLDPEGSFISWYAWGDALRHLATLKKESKYAEEALIRYEKACQTTNDEATLSHIYYNMALCYCLLGELSEEASEISTALEMLELAGNTHVDPVSIELLYAKGLSLLSRLLKRPDLSLNGMQRVTDLISTLKIPLLPRQELQCHRLLATLSSTLYKHSYDTALFSIAYQHFDHATQFLPNCVGLHLEFAQFLLFAGKVCQDLAVLQKALEHFAKSGIDTKHPSSLLMDFVEAELLMGGHTENLQLLRSAEKKMTLCINAQPHDPRTISLYTLLLSELGRYFTNPVYYNTALALLEEGFTHHPNHPSLYLSSAQVYLGLGELSKEESYLQKACHAYSMVLEHQGDETLLFYDDWASTLLRLGTLNEDAEVIEKAVHLFEKAIEVGESMHIGGAEPTDPFLNCLYSYGCALDCLGDYSQEIAHYEKAIHILSTVLVANPQHPHARYNLAVSLSHLGEVTQDIEPLRKSIELFTLLTQDDSEDEAAWQEWGVALIHLAEILQDPGRPEESKDLLKDAETKLLRSAYLGNPRAYYFLACVYSLAHNGEMSLHYLQRAAVEKCLPTPDQLAEEEWLEYLQQEPSFHNFLTQLSSDEPKA